MAIDVNALLGDAKCLDCLQPGQLDRIEVYLLRQWAGLSSQSEADSFAAARCFLCLTQDQLRLASLGALASITGSSTDPSAALTAAGCLECLVPWQMRMVSVSILYQAVNSGAKIGSNFNALLEASRCLSCFTRGQLLILKAYFLGVKAGVDDPQGLITRAGCLECLLAGQMQVAEAYYYFVASGGIVPPSETFYILFENGDRWLTEDGLNLIRKE